MTTVLANGLVIGSIYGVVALGIVLVYRNSRILNFAHGEIGMIGAFVFYALWAEQRWPYALAAACGVALAGAIGLATYLVLSGQAQNPLNMLIGTLAVAGILEFAAMEIWGPEALYVNPPLAGMRLDVAGMSFVGPRLMVLIAGAVLAGGLFLFFRYSPAALVFRAASLDPYAAQLVGVNVRVLAAVTWAAAGVLSGIAAILVAPLVNFSVFFMTLLFVRAVAAALLAGMVNVPAALGAGIALGVAESTLSRVTTQPGVPEAVLVVLIVVVLVLRSGDLGRRTA